MSEEKLNDIELSCLGIDHLVNNEWDACELLYKQHKNLSPLMNYCSSFVTFLRATLTFEDQLLEQAQKELEATEKLCSDSTKMFSSFKNAFGISSSQSSNPLQNAKKKANEGSCSLEEKFTKAIIIADCKLFLAILTFVRQEVGAYLSSGILQIRRSWKMFSRIQKQLFEIYKKLEPNADEIYGSGSGFVQIWIDDGELGKTEAASNESKQVINELTIEDDEIAGNNISLEAVKRLLGAVSFGYGVFQICLSFMPPNALKIVKLLGFEGDRGLAIKAINFTSQSKDMRAPFADMVMLWYSTVATPLFGVSEIDVRITNDDTRLILDKNLSKYSQSSLFYYFKGKFCRTSLRDLDASLENYEIASRNSRHIREIQFISIYEIGWIHLMNLNYSKAVEYFDILSKESKWSRSFNGYICSIITGSQGKFAEANQYVKESLKILASQTRKKNPIEVFATKRLEYFKKNEIKSKDLCDLLCIELLFLWICLPYCRQAELQKMLDSCDRITDKNFVALKCLFEGAIQVAMQNHEFGEQLFKESIARVEDDKKKPPFGKYILPYSHFLLATHHTNEKNYQLGKSHLNKAMNNYKDYELEDRIQTQLRSLQRRLKHLIDEPKPAQAINERNETEEGKRMQREASEKNFFLS